MLIKYNIHLLYVRNMAIGKIPVLYFSKESKESVIHLMYNSFIEINYGNNYEKTIHYHIDDFGFKFLYEDENNGISELAKINNKKYKSFVRLLKSHISNYAYKI